jgi:hypothetical protein
MVRAGFVQFKVAVSVLDVSCGLLSLPPGQGRPLRQGVAVVSRVASRVTGQPCWPPTDPDPGTTRNFHPNVANILRDLHADSANLHQQDIQCPVRVLEVFALLD